MYVRCMFKKMLIHRIWNYLKGYVIIIVEGYFLEKFLNICTHRQIFLWNIRREGNSSMKMNIGIKGFKKLRPVAKKTGCKVRIGKKKGLPFIIGRYKKRKAFLAGAVVFIILLNLMSSFIWNVEIRGNDKIDTEKITEVLTEQGIKAGILKYKIDTKELVRLLMLKLGDLAWAGVEVKGTKLKISVAERIKPPELISLDTPCSIIAAKDGMIENIVVKKGQELVKIGDTVTKGQILVSGILENSIEKTENKLVHAIAEVKARTWYEGSSIVSRVIKEQVKTGEVENRYALELFAKTINIPAGRVNFEKYELTSVKKNIRIGENFILPFAVISDKYSEINEFEREIDMQEAKQIAGDNAYSKALETIPENAVISQTSLEFVQDEKGNLNASVLIECLESIGVKQKIGGY